MNYRYKNDKGELVFTDYKTPSKKATTYPRKKDRASKAERKLAIRRSFYDSLSLEKQKGYTRAGSLKP